MGSFEKRLHFDAFSIFSCIIGWGLLGWNSSMSLALERYVVREKEMIVDSDPVFSCRSS